MVHVFSRGCVIPVVSYIRKCLEKQDTDISLIRHFVTEVSKQKRRKVIYRKLIVYVAHDVTVSTY